MTLDTINPESRPHTTEYVVPQHSTVETEATPAITAKPEAIAVPGEVKVAPKSSEDQIRQQIAESPNVKEFLNNSGQMHSILLENMLNGKVSISQLEEKLAKGSLSAAALNDLLFSEGDIPDSPHMLQ